MGRFNLEVLSAMSNADFLAEVSKQAPEFTALASEKSYDVFTEKGFQALKQISADAVTRFYGVALLVGAQQIDFFDIKNPLEGLVDRYAMGSGAYLQRTAVKRIKGVNPGWLGSDGKGLKNGDSPDQFEVRKPEVEQRYFGLNWNYQNWITLQDFDLKQGWLSENGIGAITSAIFRMIELDRAEVGFAKFFEVLNGALNSSTYALKDSQVLKLDSWTDAAPTDAEINALVILVKNIAEALDTVPAQDLYNAASYPNSASAEDHVLLVRQGMKSVIEKVMAYAFGPEYLQFPIKLKAVPNFGGLKPYYTYSNTDTDGQVVYDKNGTPVGIINEAYYVNPASPAAYKKADGKWYISAGEVEGTYAEYSVIDYEGLSGIEVKYTDPNENVIAVLYQKGGIFEIMQNEMATLPARNERGFYTNVWFNQPDNGVNFDYYRNLVAICKPTA